MLNFWDFSFKQSLIVPRNPETDRHFFNMQRDTIVKIISDLVSQKIPIKLKNRFS